MPVFPIQERQANNPPSIYYDIEKREEKKVMGGTGNFGISGDGKSILVLQGTNLGIIKPAPDQKIDKAIAYNGDGNDGKSPGRMEPTIQ